MNKTELNPIDSCLLCGELMNNYRVLSTECTNFSGIAIEDLLNTFIIPQAPSNSSLCQNCFIKLDELDEHLMVAEKIKSELMHVYNQQTHSKNLQDFKIKEEEADEEMFFDENSKSKTFLNLSDLKKTPKEPKPIDDSVEIRIERGTTIYECIICKKIMKHRGHMAQHVLIHKNIRNFCCQQCGMTFKLKSHLNSHRKTHTGKERMTCDICGKLFDQKFYLREHMSAIHLDIRKFSCTICGMTFGRKRCFIGHSRVHQTEADKKQICEICGFRCHTRQAMIRHSRTHTGEKNFPCGICNKLFACDYNVAAHVKAVHQGIKPKVDERKLRCMLCGRKFPRQKQLKRHLLEEHNMQEEFNLKNEPKTEHFA